MSNSLIVRKNSGNSLTILKSGSLSVSLPPATNTTLGGIIVGDNLSITGNGVLSAQPGGVTAFNNRTGNVSLTSNDVTSALTYTPLTTSTAYSNLSFTGTSSSSPFNFKVQNANGSKSISMLSVTAGTSDIFLQTSSTRANGQIDTYYPFIRLYTDPVYPDINEGKLLLQYNYTANASTGPYYNTSIQIGKTKAEFFAQTYTWTDNSLLTRFYADTRYLTSANLTYANLTGTPTTLAGYGITDGLTSANLTPYLTISSANSTYAVLGHTHSIANVTGLQTALDAKLPSANFTYANLTGTPNLTLYLTTANASSTYQPLGNYATTSCLTFSNITGKPTTLSGYGITDGYSTSNPSGYITSACLTYSNITGTPAAYTLPTANTTTLGGVKVDGTSVTISNGTISVSTTYAGLGANTFTGAQALGGNLLTQPKLQAYRETSTAPTISSGTLTLDLSGSNFFAVSLNAAITTLTISNTPASSAASFTLELTADGTARAVTWGAAIKWSGGTAPTLTSTSGKKDVFAFYSNDGGTTWQGFIGGQNF